MTSLCPFQEGFTDASGTVAGFTTSPLRILHGMIGPKIQTGKRAVTFVRGLIEVWCQKCRCVSQFQQSTKKETTMLRVGDSSEVKDVNTFFFERDWNLQRGWAGRRGHDRDVPTGKTVVCTQIELSTGSRPPRPVVACDQACFLGGQ
jgi:hypothetical protein